MIEWTRLPDSNPCSPNGNTYPNKNFSRIGRNAGAGYATGGFGIRTALKRKLGRCALEGKERRMNAEQIAKSLEAYTARYSRYELIRDYISLSNCALSVDELIDQYRVGFADGITIRLRCYKGYQMEDDLRGRLIKTHPEFISAGGEISAFDGIVKGHPDFRFDRRPGDCKSVLMDSWIPENGKLPRKVYWQMQGYMLYGYFDESLVVYESRESGRIKAFAVRANPKIQEEIDKKLRQVVAEIERKAA